jgi:hypothetical protein
VLFDSERDINGLSANDRLQRRQQGSRPLVDELEVWLRSERTKLSRSSPVTEPVDYMLNAGTASHPSSGMAGSASPTTPPIARCAASLWAGRHGSLPAPTVVLIAPPSWQL